MKFSTFIIYFQQSKFFSPSLDPSNVSEICPPQTKKYVRDRDEEMAIIITILYSKFTNPGKEGQDITPIIRPLINRPKGMS